MIFQGMLTLMLFAVVIYFFLKLWPIIFGSDNADSIDLKIEELKKKREHLETLEKAYDVQKEIEKCEKEIEKLNYRLTKLKNKTNQN